MDPLDPKLHLRKGRCSINSDEFFIWNSITVDSDRNRDECCNRDTNVPLGAALFERRYARRRPPTSMDSWGAALAAQDLKDLLGEVFTARQDDPGDSESRSD